MDKITKINSGEKFTHTSVGKLAEFNGKQFLKDTVGTTGCEISFGTIEPINKTKKFILFSVAPATFK